MGLDNLSSVMHNQFMPAKQSYEVTMALKWISTRYIGKAMDMPYWVRKAAGKFGVHESTLWRALGKINHRSETK